MASISPFSATWRNDIAAFLKKTFSSGNLEQLANLTLQPNKVLRTNASSQLTQSDITAAATALLNMDGTAVPDSMPFFYSNTAAALTPLTPYARTILDDTTGAAIFATMGATQSFGGLLSSGYQKLPSGLIIQWGSSVVTTGSEVAVVNYPTTYPTAVFTTVVCNGDTNSVSSSVFGVHDGTGRSGFVLRTNGVSGTVRANWLSVGI